MSHKTECMSLLCRKQIKTVSPNGHGGTRNFLVNCILPKIWRVYLLSVDNCFYLVKNHLLCSIYFCHIIQGDKHSMAEIVPKRSLFKPNLGNAKLYIFKSSLSSNIVLLWLIPVNYVLYTLKKKSAK